MCVWVCLPPSTENASSVWVWNSRGQINDVVLKTFLSSTKSFHRYFSMKHQAFLTSRFILFTHQKRTKPRLNVMCVSLSKIWDLQLQLSGIAFGPHYIVSQSAWCVSTHKSGQKSSSNDKLQYCIQFRSSPWEGISEDLFVLIEHSSIAPTNSSCWCTGWNLLVR